MKTFTVRDLDRRPALVLEACDQEGEVRIRRRNGRQYSLRVADEPPRNVPWRKLVAAHRARLRKIFPEPLTRKQTRLVDQMLAGE